MNWKLIGGVIGGFFIGLVLLSVVSGILIAKRGGGCPVAQKYSQQLNSTSSSDSEYL